MVRNYYEQPYSKKLDNLCEMDKYLETYNLPILNQEEAQSLNRLITTSKIEAVVKKTPAHKSSEPDSFTGEFYQTFKEEITLILPKIFQKIQEEGELPNSFHEANIVIIPQPAKDKRKKENYRPISLINIDAKILNKICQSGFRNTLKRSYTMIKWDSSQGCKDGTIFTNQ